MSRYENRTFRQWNGLREQRVVDTQSPDALVPVGTTITCTGGHELFEVAESIHPAQLITAEMFGPPRAFQKPVVNGQRLGPCICGREFIHRGAFHTKDGWKGWKR